MEKKILVSGVLPSRIQAVGRASEIWTENKKVAGGLGE
jgi:hypothetical protein